VGAPEATNSTRLFETIEMCGVTARNRIMISPMCQYCAPDAVPHDWHFVHLGSRAAGGAGIVVTEATAVEPAGRITPYDLGLWNDEQESAFARIAAFVSEQGALAGVQLAHAGRKASHARPWEDRSPLLPGQGGWEVIGPSALSWKDGDLVPREMTLDDISRVTTQFRDSAKRALRAGFQLVELHAAHGYLFHSFLSPLSNRRSDAYGGDFNGRTRFLLETVQAVREVWPSELPLFVRISATDWVEGGWQLADSIELARRLRALDVDVIDCSGGGNLPEQEISPYPGYQVPFAEAIRREADVRTAAVGLIGEPKFAEEIIAKDRADIVVIGRMALWDPYWPHHAAKALGGEVKLPLQYRRSDIF
jgi:2,4-dienoyl-CoA reductase-like NADH-dependent reductase (Old Yellow Enzyme family)